MTAPVVRIATWLAAACVVAVVATWMLLPALVSSDLVRSAIEREFEDIAGQKIHVDGKVDIDLFPAPVARLHDLRLSGTPTAAGEMPSDLLLVDSVEVSIGLSSLISRQPEFSQFRLVRPAMRIPVDERGRIDIGAIGGRLGREIAREAAADATTASDEAEHARFGTVTIENGAIDFIGPDGKVAERITAVNGTLSWPRFDARLTAALTGIWRGVAFQQKIEIDRALQFITGDIVDVRQDFTSDLLTLSFNGQAGAGEQPFIEGRVSMNTPTTRQALEWLGTGIRMGGAVGALSLTAQVQGDAKKLRFDDLKANLQDSAGTGVMEIAFGLGGKPSLTATLDFAAIDIPASLSALTGLPRTVAAFSEPASAELLKQMNLDLRLSADAATLGALRFTELAAVAQIRDGGALLELADATAYGGRLQANLKLNAAGDALSGAFGVTASELDGAAAADLLQLDGLLPRGRTDASLDISAPIERWSDLFTQAEGKMAVSVTSGQLQGVAFDSFGREADDRSFFNLRDATRSGDVFDRLDITALIGDGVIVIDRGAIAYPAGTVQLNGVIPYASASVALTTSIAPQPDANGPVPAVQHFIGGSWEDPYAVLVRPAPEDN